MSHAPEAGPVCEMEVDPPTSHALARGRGTLSTPPHALTRLVGCWDALAADNGAADRRWSAVRETLSALYL